MKLYEINVYTIFILGTYICILIISKYNKKWNINMNIYESQSGDRFIFFLSQRRTLPTLPLSCTLPRARTFLVSAHDILKLTLHGT